MLGSRSPESIRSNGNIMKLDILSRIGNSMTEIQFVNTHLRTVESLESVYADISIYNMEYHTFVIQVNSGQGRFIKF